MIALPEAPSGMEGVQGQHGDNDHDALEHDKVSLILDQLALPPLRQLDDTVDAADEDADGGQGQGDEEPFEFGRGAQGGVAGFAHVLGCAWRAGSAGIALGADGEVEAHEDEDGEGEDLEREPGDHDVVTRFGRFVVVRCHAGHAAADGLEQQGDEVARDEEARIRQGFDSGIGLPDRDHDARQGQVDACGEEGGGDGQTDNLHQKSVLPDQEVSSGPHTLGDPPCFRRGRT